MAAFGYYAGYAGAAIAMLAWAHQLAHFPLSKPLFPPQSPTIILTSHHECSLSELSVVAVVEPWIFVLMLVFLHLRFSNGIRLRQLRVDRFPKSRHQTFSSTVSILLPCRSPPSVIFESFKTGCIALTSWVVNARYLLKSLRKLAE